MIKKTLGKTSPTRSVTRKSPAKTEAAAGAKRTAKPAKELAKTASKSAVGKTAASKTPASKTAAKAAAVAAGDPLDAFITAAAITLALPVEPQWMPAIKANLEATLRLGALVTEFELSDEVEPAPVFGA
jgi:Protein of unknown function (DUF4089)